MKNIICLGNLSYNMNFFVNSSIIENYETNIVKKYKSIGNLINIPIILSKNDLNVYYLSTLANDYEGNEIIKYLKYNNIKTDYINIVNDKKTNKKYIIRNTKNDNKIILTERNNFKYKLPKYLNFIPDIIYNDNYDIETIRKIKHNNTKVITNLKEISEKSLNTCILSDYIVIPLKYAQMLTNVKLNISDKKSIIDLYLKTKKLFSGKILIYIEKVGCLFENDNIISIISKIGDKTKKSKNSYDIFISTLIYCIANNYEINTSIKISMLAKFLSDNNKQNINIKEVIRLYEKNS